MRRRDFLRMSLASAAALASRSLCAEDRPPARPPKSGKLTASSKNGLAESIAHSPGLPPGVFRVAAPRDAAAAASLDCAALAPHDRLGSFYIWDQVGSRESAGVLSWTVNAVMNQTAYILKPRIISTGDVRLLCWNLYDLCPKTPDFERLWKALQTAAEFEWVFHQPSALGEQRKTVYKTVKPYVASNGKTYDYTSHEIVDYRGFEFSLYANAGALNLLSDMTGGSLLPIVRADWFLATALTSLKKIEGIRGQYYEWRGIKGLNFDGLLKRIGADPKLRDDFRQRGVQISDVTGLWRTVSTEPIISGNLENGQGALTFTLDLNDTDDDDDKHGILNLVDLKADAKEIIFSLPNGLDGWYLTNGEGVEQEEAPPNVASWPDAPWKRKHLPAGISCIDCHKSGSGLRTVTNVVLSNDRAGFSPLFNLHSKGGRMANKETQNIIRAQYLGDVEAGLVPRRLSYAKKVDEATLGAFRETAGENNAVVVKASTALVEMYRDYFDDVTPRRLLAEMGYRCRAEIAKAVLERCIPKEEDEDGRIGTLLKDGRIKRYDIGKTFFEFLKRDAFRSKQ